jgi:hypothetical protein
MSEEPTTHSMANPLAIGAKLSIEQFSKLIAICSSCLYVIGFVAVTSYLSTKGIYDQALLSARYLMAGGLTLVVGGFYYFMVWKKVVQRINTGIRWPTPISQPLRLFLDTYYAIEFAYACCYVSAIVCSVLVPNSQALLISILLSVGFLIDGLLVSLGAYQAWRLMSYVATAILNATLCVAFLIYGFSRPPLLALAGTFLTFTIVGSVVVSSPSWKSIEDRIYSRLYLAFYAVIAVCTFGATVYSKIDQRFGGQAAQKAEVLLAAEASSDLKSYLDTNKNQTFLIFESDTAITIQLGDPNAKSSKVMKIDKKLVQGITATPPTLSDAGAGLSEQIKTLLSHK